MKRTVILFSTLIIALLCLFKLSTYSFVSGDLSIEIAVTVIAVVFFGIGFYINRKNLDKKSFHIPKKDSQKLAQLGLSKREHEVLQEIALGLSNKEVADKLFVSESTVKTHVSNILVKLDAKRRTQAIRKAREYQIIT